jgi:hypothetical protein
MYIMCGVYSQRGVLLCRKLVKKIEDEEKKGRVGPAFWLQDIVKRLEEAHRILQWTFCLTYYMKAGKAKNAFEEQQAMLSKKTDEFHSVWQCDMI